MKYSRIMVKYTLAFCFFLSFTYIPDAICGSIKRIWLTHHTNTPDRIMINWQSRFPGISKVCYRIGNGIEKCIVTDENTSLHHVELPLPFRDSCYHYQVVTGEEKSEIQTFKGYPSSGKELRIAIVGDWGYARNPDFTKLLLDDPHLLLTVGDNVPDLHSSCGEGVQDCVEPYLKLIDSEPELFSALPIIPILGNHDKEIRLRGVKYPPITSYDINATAYRTFFELPDDEWRWHFKIPDFQVSFIALDLNHTSDFGTTWQTCHDFRTGSDQMNWYCAMLKMNSENKIITLQNEKNQTMRNLENGKWQELFEKGNAVITGYGYFAERANVKGFPYFNTALYTGDLYPDDYSEFIKVVNSYILITINENRFLIQIKSDKGVVMDSYLLE